MTTVKYDLGRDTLYVSGIATPFPPGSLQARELSGQLAVANPQDGTLLCGWLDFDQWTIGGVSTFATVDEAFAALAYECSRKRPVGDLIAAPAVILSLGQSVIGLARPPALLSAVRMEVNGVVYRPPDIGVSDVAVTWLNPDFPLSPSDAVTVVYP